MVTLTSKQWAFYAFSAILALGILGLGRDEVTSLFAGNETNKVGLPELRSELQRIALNKGDHWREDPVEYDKGVITGVTGHLLSSQRPDAVLSYYSVLLPTIGWAKARDEVMADGRHLMYCKQGISLTIDTSKGGMGTDYYFGLVWTTYASSDAYCPQEASATH